MIDRTVGITFTAEQPFEYVPNGTFDSIFDTLCGSQFLTENSNEPFSIEQMDRVDSAASWISRPLIPV
jgi:hypothetical protein